MGYLWYIKTEQRLVNEAIAATITAHCGLDSSHDMVVCSDGKRRKLWGLRTKNQVLLVHRKFRIGKDFNVFKRGFGEKIYPANHHIIKNWRTQQEGSHTIPICT